MWIVTSTNCQECYKTSSKNPQNSACTSPGPKQKFTTLELVQLHQQLLFWIKKWKVLIGLPILEASLTHMAKVVQSAYAASVWHQVVCAILQQSGNRSTCHCRQSSTFTAHLSLQFFYTVLTHGL